MHFQWAIFAQLSITTTIRKKLGKNYSRLIAWLFPWECAKFFVVSFVPFDFDRLKYRALTLWSLNSFPDSGRRRRRPAKDIFDFHFFFIRICFLSLPCRSSCHSFFIYFVIFFFSKQKARATDHNLWHEFSRMNTHTYIQTHEQIAKHTHTYMHTCIDC